jgi:hypothetical protein
LPTTCVRTAEVAAL